MILRLDLFFNFVVLADELLDGVLLQHAKDVSLGVEILTVDVHVVFIKVRFYAESKCFDILNIY